LIRIKGALSRGNHKRREREQHQKTRRVKERDDQSGMKRARVPSRKTYGKSRGKMRKSQGIGGLGGKVLLFN